MSIKKISILMTTWLMFCSYTVYAAIPNTDSLVKIRKATENSNDFAIGFVVDKERNILANMKNTKESLHVYLANGTVIYAEMIKYDKTTNLALIKPNAAALDKVPSPYVFAKQPAKTQRQVSAFNLASPFNKSVLINGTLAKIFSGVAPQPIYYQHNALTSANNVGTPLFNNCGEVVGVVSTKPRSLFSRTKKEGAVAYAVASEWVVKKITDINNIDHTTNDCLSILAQAEATEKAAAEKIKAEKVAREAAQKVAREKEGEAKKAAEERDAAQKVAREKEGEAKKAAEERDAAQKVAREKEGEAKKADEKKAQYREYINWSIAAGIILLALLLLFMRLKRRARLQAKSATEKAEVTRNDLTAIQNRDARIAATPEVFIEGGTASERFALRIPPAELAKEGGVIIGRNPQNCDFIINHPQVSRQQFKLTYENNALMICDLNSSNGTSVDGRKLTSGESAMLANNSRIEINQLNFITQTSAE